MGQHQAHERLGSALDDSTGQRCGPCGTQLDGGALHLGHVQVGTDKQPVYDIFRLHQGRDRFGIEDQKGFCLKIFEPPGHFGGHFVDQFRTLGGVTDKHNRFGSVSDHRFEFIQIGNRRRHVLNRPHGHDPVDVLHCIGHPGAVDNILYMCGMDFAGEGIHGVGARRGRSVIAFTALYFHGALAVTTVNGISLGSGVQTGVDNMLRDSDMLAPDLAAGLFEHLSGASMQDVKTDLGHDVKAGPSDFLHLAICKYL